MGQAGDKLARLLDVFVKLPIPKVNFLEVSELQMALAVSEERILSRRFVRVYRLRYRWGGLGYFSDSSFSDMAKLLKYRGEINRTAELELLMDVASILVELVQMASRVSWILASASATRSSSASM